ncbi:MAG: CapA family protein [Alphaproteobacteria bacterium]|nr:CapA family protein [Alphaproteobacteria bacterium]
MPSSLRPLVLLSSLATVLGGGLACGELPDRDVDYPNPLRDAEHAARLQLETVPVAVQGRVVDDRGAPLAGAEVEVDGHVTHTDATGAWTIPDLPRRNALLRVDAAGFRRWVSAVHLVEPVTTATVTVPTLPMVVDDPGTVRFLFTGDMALGRRYLDPDEATPRDQMPPYDPEALIRPGSVASDSIALVDSMLPYFEAADYRVVNLETPVTDDPSTPHETKLYAFFTLPDSLAALTHLGVGFVSQGNNHVYDYLDQGITDTLANLDAWGLGHAGAGHDPDSAFVPYRTDVGGLPFTFFSATSITGEDRAFPLFVATDTQGGAADLSDTARVTTTLQGERAAGRIPIALLHGGNEYARDPNAYLEDRFDLVHEAGAAFAIAHHPHTIQGFSRRDGMFVAHSMGNFVFDQDRLETLSAYTLHLDFDGQDVVRAKVLPHVIDGYHARPTTGGLADRTAREAGELSDHRDVYVMSYASVGLISEDAHDRVVTHRTVDATVDVGLDGFGYLDLRPFLTEGESLSTVTVDGEASRLWLGTDLLRFGSFEDDDVDGDLLEAARWFRGDAAEVCLTGAFRGTVGMCTYRDETNTAEASVAFRNRVRVLGDSLNEPNRDLTFFARTKADNVGTVRIYARFQASFGDKVFGDQTLVLDKGGSWDWKQVTVPIAMPDDVPNAADPWADNPRAVRVFVAHGPPEAGAGRLAVDDLAVATWHMGPWDVDRPIDVATPHAAEFVRVEGRTGTLKLTATLEHAVPAVVATP